MNRSWLACLALTCSFAAAHAQFYTGLRGSAYGGITNVTFNPAIANNPFLVDINLIGVAATLNNNYVGVHRKALLQPTLFNDANFQGLYMQERVNGRNKQAYVGAQIQGPLSFMFSFGPKKKRNLNAIGFSYHANAVFNADNVTEVFARTAYHGLGVQANAITNYLGNRLYNGNLSTKMAMWNDFGITYSRVLYNKRDMIVKAGGTLKLIQPIAGAYGFVRDLDYEWTEYELLNIYNTEVQYAHSDNLNADAAENVQTYLQNAMSFKNGRPTAAVDLGAVFEWWPEHGTPEMDCQCETFTDVKQYKIAAGISMMDLGALRFKRGQYSNNFYADIRNWNVGGAQYPDGLQSFDDTVNARFAQQPGGEYFTIWLPTRFNVFVDYNIAKGFGATFTALVSPNMSPQWRMVHHVTTFAITGKYENKWVGAYVPLSVDVMGNVSLGATLRLGPLTIGMQDLLGLFAKKFVYNADVHANLKITIPYHKICRKGDLRFMKKS